MNHLIAQKAMLIDMTHNLRTEILEAITNADLTFLLGGSSLSLADLLLEQGRFQMAYRTV
jgi:molybdopterin biosynthesis enzyme